MRFSVLPYWDQNVDIELAPWTPYEKDYTPVSVNTLFNPTLGKLAGFAFEVHSELFAMHSFHSGSMGTLARHNLIDSVSSKRVEPGFSMVFAYSEAVEHSVLALLPFFPGLMAGITLCDIWRDDVLVDECKVLMVMSEDPIFDETPFVEALCEAFKVICRKQKPNTSYFAEKFGYKRFSISYETDDTTLMRITQALFDMELDATKAVLGPMPELKVPQFVPSQPQKKSE
ncbi:MAG: hypothetical protein Q4E17_06235 [Synergistes sp.]|nr:hypothetical protein [Synergistes sp.]